MIGIHSFLHGLGSMNLITPAKAEKILNDDPKGCDVVPCVPVHHNTPRHKLTMLRKNAGLNRFFSHLIILRSRKIQCVLTTLLCRGTEDTTMLMTMWPHCCCPNEIMKYQCNFQIIWVWYNERICLSTATPPTTQIDNATWTRGKGYPLDSRVNNTFKIAKNGVIEEVWQNLMTTWLHCRCPTKLKSIRTTVRSPDVKTRCGKLRNDAGRVCSRCNQETTWLHSTRRTKLTSIPDAISRAILSGLVFEKSRRLETHRHVVWKRRGVHVLTCKTRHRIFYPAK